MFTKTVIALAVIVSTASAALAADRYRPSGWHTYDYDSSVYFGRAWKNQGGPKHGMCGCSE